MRRIPEPELMTAEDQALAYAEADFSVPHDQFVALFADAFPDFTGTGRVLDLGCGPADVAIRFARRYPDIRIDGVDGAAAMLDLGREAVRRHHLGARIRLVPGYLPGAELPESAYDGVISNSLLHHLADPAVLWMAIRRYGKPGCSVFVMDLSRPADAETAARLVAEHAAHEPEVLRRDFHNSLLAAYRPDEVAAQLRAAGLVDFTVAAAGGHHLTVAGRGPH